MTLPLNVGHIIKLKNEENFQIFKKSLHSALDPDHQQHNTDPQSCCTIWKFQAFDRTDINYTTFYSQKQGQTVHESEAIDKIGGRKMTQPGKKTTGIMTYRPRNRKKVFNITQQKFFNIRRKTISDNTHKYAVPIRIMKSLINIWI